jgi:hypothetical protein
MDFSIKRCRRADCDTRQHVERAIAPQHGAGLAEAQRYLVNAEVTAEVAQRVLNGPGARRDYEARQTGDDLN